MSSLFRSLSKYFRAKMADPHPPAVLVVQSLGVGLVIDRWLVWLPAGALWSQL